MPLNTQIIRDGAPLTLRWGDFHVAAMAIAASIDDPDRNGKGIFKVPTFVPDFAFPADAEHEYAGMTGADYPACPCPITMGEAFEIASYPCLGMTPLNDGPYTLRREHRFIDCHDGEVLHLLPGDILKAVRV